MIQIGRLNMLLLAAGTAALLAGCEGGDQQPAETGTAPVSPTEEQQAPPAQQPVTPPQDQTGQSPAQEPGTAGTAQQETGADQQMAQQQPPAGEGAPTPQAAGGDPEAMMKQAGCFACHAVGTKLIGPAYSWVAARYQDDPNAVQTLVQSIQKGSQGKWTQYTGGVPMPPNLQVSEQQAQAMAEWILQVEPQQPPQ